VINDRVRGFKIAAITSALFRAVFGRGLRRASRDGHPANPNMIMTYAPRVREQSAPPLLSARVHRLTLNMVASLVLSCDGGHTATVGHSFGHHASGSRNQPGPLCTSSYKGVSSLNGMFSGHGCTSTSPLLHVAWR
jgi:hypothetical protein